LVPNALDAAGLPPHPPLTRLRKEGKVFGYIGTMSTWFDWTWVVHLANVRQADTVRLIGPIDDHYAGKLPNNIQLYPACHHSAALQAMQEFDVGLIPFKRNPVTDAVDPIKYYEYRALGLPVIATLFGEMYYHRLTSDTYISESLADIPMLAESALSTPRTIAATAEFIQQNSWESRFDATQLLTLS
ncbi:MAG: hypothetical protein ACK4RS_04820, partial [Thiothrix sp.]